MTNDNIVSISLPKIKLLSMYIKLFSLYDVPIWASAQVPALENWLKEYNAVYNYSTETLIFNDGRQATLFMLKYN